MIKKKVSCYINQKGIGHMDGFCPCRGVLDEEEQEKKMRKERRSAGALKGEGFKGFHFLLLCILMVISTALLPGKVLAAKVSLSKDMAFLKKGERLHLTINQKAEWDLWDLEDQKNVVSISPSKDGRSCTVLAKKNGYAIVIARVGNKSYNCWISVPRYKISVGKSYRFYDEDKRLHMYLEVTNKSRKSVFLSYWGESYSPDTLEYLSSSSGIFTVLEPGATTLLDFVCMHVPADAKVFYAITNKESNPLFKPGAKYLSVESKKKGKTLIVSLKNKSDTKKLWHAAMTVIFLKGDKAVGIGDGYVESIEKGGSVTVKVKCSKDFTSAKVYPLVFLKKMT